MWPFTRKQEKERKASEERQRRAPLSGYSSHRTTRDETMDILNPANILSPINPIYGASSSQCDAGSSYDSGSSCDSGSSYDSGSSSSSFD